MKKTYLLGLCLLLLSSSAYAQQKIAIVSINRALNQSEAGKKSMNTIKNDINAKKKKLDAMKANLKKMRDEIEKQKNILSKEALQTKMSEIQTKFMELQQKAQQYDQELKQKEAEAVQKISTELSEMALSMAKKEKYDLLLENSQGQVMYAPNAKDLTDDLIKAYNRKRR